MLHIDTKIETFPRVGKKYGDTLGRLGIATVRDFLLHFPFRYEDYSERVPIDKLSADSTATVMGEVIQSKLVRTWKKKMLITECHISDGTGILRTVWFNQPYVSDSLTKGKGVRVSGKVSRDTKGLYMSNPAWELSSREPTNTDRLVPIYPETEGLTSRWIRWQMQSLIKYASEIEDPIPEDILKSLHLPKISDALKYIQFPKTCRQTELARKRFAFQQMFLVQLASQRVKISWEKQSASSIMFNENFIKKFVMSLPFSLTNAQRKAAFQIFKDMEKPVPMNRLLNGDVGSGKTIVAAMASLGTIRENLQVAIMAPTEILARQHFENTGKLFKDFDYTTALLTNAYRIIFSKGKMESIPREEMLRRMKNGEVHLIIGTHALIQSDIRFKNLALIIVDEQHRFGVAQRAYLQQKAAEINDGLKGKIPHFLTMTATPIPRSLALAFFGNLSLSILDEMPKNRKPIVTKLVGARERQETYDFIRAEIKNGRQAFIIFPLVEESEALSEVKAATQEHEKLSKKIFPDLKLALLHGKIKAQEKEKIMEAFKNKEYDILVATSVVEVGIDIPNATFMIIEDADRFGLSQLHQFRGRVGRGEHQSYCFLFTSSSTVKTKDRLKALVKYASGFDIAQKDFELRGPGEFLGNRQSGIPDIAMQHLVNIKLIEIASDYAEKTLRESPSLEKYPLLKKELGKFQEKIHLE